MKKHSILRNIFCCFFAFLLIFNFSSEVYAQPSLNSYLAASIYEPKTDSIVYSHNGDKRMYPASTTKVMTIALTLKYVKNLEEKVTTGSELSRTPVTSSTAGLYQGETLSYRDLLYGLMLPSGNDAAIVLACNVGKKIAGDDSISKDKGYDVFIKEMNTQAKKLKMTKTHFANPHGFHSKSHYTTSNDFARLVAYASSVKGYKKVVNTLSYTTKTNKTTHTWTSHNALLIRGRAYYSPYATGDKTGYTDTAGRCIVFSCKKSTEDGDKKFYGALFHANSSQEQFGEAKNLITYALNNTKIITIDGSGKTLYKYDIENPTLGKTGTLKVTTTEDIAVCADKSYSEDDYKIKFVPDKKLLTIDKNNKEKLTLSSSINEDDVVGTIKVIRTTDSKVIRDIEAKSKNNVDMLSYKDRLLRKGLLVLSLVFVILLGLITASQYRTKKRINQRNRIRRRIEDFEKRQYGRSYSQDRKPNIHSAESRRILKENKIKVVKKKSVPTKKRRNIHKRRRK